MPKITNEALAELRAKHPRGVVVLTVHPEDLEGEAAVRAGNDFAFKKIDRTAFAQHRSAIKQAMATGGGTGEEETALARSLLVWPAVEAFDQLREDAPAMASALGQELLADARAGQLVSRDPR